MLKRKRSAVFLSTWAACQYLDLIAQITYVQTPPKSCKEPKINQNIFFFSS